MLKSKLSEVLEKNPSAADLRVELERILSEVEARLKPKVIILAGSMAEGKFVRGMSDIDLFVVADEARPKSTLRVVGNVDVEITVYTPEEASNAIRRGNQFVIRAVKSEVVLIGEKTVEELVRDLDVESRT
jgi:hypothetical protein